MLKRSLIRSVCLLLPLSGITLVTAPSAAVAQTKLAPDHSVMGVRLEGVWQDDAFEYSFETGERGQVRFRQVERATGREEARGTLEPALSKGMMRGEVRYTPKDRLAYTKELQAWIADDRRLWMNGANATPDYKAFVALRKPPEPALQQAWNGKWRTNRGMLEVESDGRNFFAWITRTGSTSKERVAFRATPKQATGGWDSEWDAGGNWLHKPARWGDLHLTLSEDGNSFTGWYSAPKAQLLGQERHNWTGERVDRRPGTTPPTPPVIDPRPNGGAGPVKEAPRPTVDLIRLTGKWEAPWGSVEILGGGTRFGRSTATVHGIVRAPARDETHFSVRVVEGALQGSGLENNFDGYRTMNVRLVDEDTLEMVITDGPAFDRRTTLTARRVAAATTSTALEGRWETSLGNLMLRAEGGHLLGAIEPKAGGSEGRMLLAIHQFDESGQPMRGYAGAWRAAVTGWDGAGVVRFDPASDGRSFTGAYTRIVGGKPVEQSWSGRRVAEAPSQPTPTSPRPAPAPTPAPAPRAEAEAEAEAEAPAGDFQPLGKWDVRLDRVENPRDDRLTHVYLTLRNPGTTELLQTQGVWVYLETSDGTEQKSGQGLRAVPGYPQLFGSPSPVVRPGKEIRTKFVFDRHQGANPIRITVDEGGKQATYDF